MKKQTYLLFLSGVITGILIAYWISKKVTEPEIMHYSEIKTHWDTVFVEVPTQPIVLEKIKTKTVIKRDTVIQTKPFTAKIDTVVLKDTVRAQYDFPENEMSIFVRPSPDSLEIRKITILKTIEKKQPWWETPVYLLGGAAFGFALGTFSK